MHASFLLIDSAQPQVSAVVNDIAERLLRRSAPRVCDDGVLHRQISVESYSKDRGAFLDEYERCRRILVQAVESDARVIVWFLRTPDDTHMNALVAVPSYGRLCAMLVLAVPEATFVEAKSLEAMMRGYVLWSHGLLPLLDASGIRTAVRKRMKNDVEVGADARYLALRKQLAVAIDDEESYAYLHAYTAFRNGFRAVLVGSDDLATFVLGKSAPLGQPRLSFEDLFITFADGSHGYSWLRQRDEILPLLKSTPLRIFVTSGLRQQDDKERVVANDNYLATLRAKGRYIKMLAKPQAGMYRLWRKSGLTRRLKPSSAGGRRGTGKGYQWPPVDTMAGPGRLSVHKVTHSADGTLTLIAQSLVDRAQNIVAQNHPSIRESVRGAVLATEALELLGGRTPALSVEALRLKHELEVIAECRFSGVAYHFPVRPRFKEITRDARLFSQWFKRTRRTSAQMNAELSILTRLVRVFVEHGHFNEELTCTNRIRRVHDNLWLRANPLRFPAWLVLRYVDYLLVSFPRFVVILVLWLAVLTTAYHYDEHTHVWQHSAQDAITSFFSIGAPVHDPAHEKRDHPELDDALPLTPLGPPPQPVLKAANQPLPPRPLPPSPPPWRMNFVWVASAAIVLGFVHLGVFLSHLYSILRRK